MADLLDRLVERIRQTGPIRFDHYVEAALYDPDFGFFSRGSGAGRAGGDFLTSPEVGPLFGALFARQLDRLWIEAGRPERFEVAEGAAGRGALAIAVRAAEPECAAALTYHLVERSAELRDRQRDHLPIDAARAAVGPTFQSHGALGDVDGPIDVIFANELLDNIPFRLLERGEEGWTEVYVDMGADNDSGPGTDFDNCPGTSDGRGTGSTDAVGRGLVEIVRAAPELDDWAEVVASGAECGVRIPYQLGAASWLDEAIAKVSDRGVVIAVDYCRSTGELAQFSQADWMRTYHDHGRGDPPLLQPGTQDITCDVAWDQLLDHVENGELVSNIGQAEWLKSLGIDELVDEGRRIWSDNADAPDLTAIRARSRISEAEALCDESGLGGFRVLTWRRRK